jgi:ABC-type phosphate/phosphonate transport system substrate-binding protein
MYSAGSHAALAWRRLFEPIFAALSLDIRVIEHGWPEPLEALWARSDLGCAFMCGWPFARTLDAMQPIAVPVPSPARYAGLPRYCSEFLVREATGWCKLQDTFGHHFGWMAENSQSGFNAPRAHLSGLLQAHPKPLYSRVSGPLGTPIRALDALRAAQVDVIALDSYFLDLCRLHQPRSMQGLRSVATTTWSAIPLLVAAPSVSAQIVQNLRDRLTCIHGSPDYASALAELLIERFDVPDLGSYAAFESMAALSAQRGYEHIQ